MNHNKEEFWGSGSLDAMIVLVVELNDAVVAVVVIVEEVVLDDI